MRNFRDSRIARILAGETPRPLSDAPKVVTHLLPVEAFDPGFRLDLRSKRWAELRNVGVPFSHTVPTPIWQIFNFDGYLVYEGRRDSEETGTYCQIFHCGAVELVISDGLIRAGENLIDALAFETYVLKDVDKYLKTLKDLGFNPPIYALVSVLGVEGHEVNLTPGQRDRGLESRPIDRPDLLLPDAVIKLNFPWST